MSTYYRVDTSELYSLSQDTKTAALFTPFSEISICGIPARNPPPSPLGWLVHWRIQGYYWNSDGSQHTLIFNTNKDQTTHITEVDVYHRPYGPSNNQQAAVSFPMLKHLTGQGLIDMIEHKNLHRYRYSDLGSGCLTWSRLRPDPPLYLPVTISYAFADVDSTGSDNYAPIPEVEVVRAVESRTTIPEQQVEVVEQLHRVFDH
ncbi:hypothetical protein PILCRDRAFT_90746 [Piloderma croceum F 1598]|uniref:DUF7770 domain-containing protein n=1 Tax=Piloderma croceum (strain F 1598) TaxID=765440 RepID=A0A0C3FE34_PILCF|nr:hypothetical protein PILCRDRAFT_90746 [Piloderma croceum F 1598]